MSSSSSRVLAKCVESGHDIWYEILSRVPTKSLVTSKCVCKAWCDFGCQILVQQRKMPFLSTRGVFFCIDKFTGINRFVGSYLIYVPLATTEVVWRVDSPSGNIINYGNNEHGNLSLDLNPLYVEPDLFAINRIMYYAHKGLILIVHMDGTYKLVNPATKQALELPNPPSEKTWCDKYKYQWIFSNAIINLSCPLSSSACSFVVMRFMKEFSLVDLYYPITRKWVRCGFSLDKRMLYSMWYLNNYVYIGETRTLYLLTSLDQGVAFQFGSLDYEPKICASYCFSLPEVVRRGLNRTRIWECQGSLYLSHGHLDKAHAHTGIWIWKRCGVSLSWILLFEFSYAARLCKPLVQKHFARFCHAGHDIYFMGFHPKIGLVYFYVNTSLFSYDLTNDTWVQIGVLAEKERPRLTITYPYTPCLASLGSFMI